MRQSQADVGMRYKLNTCLHRPDQRRAGKRPSPDVLQSFLHLSGVNKTSSKARSLTILPIESVTLLVELQSGSLFASEGCSYRHKSTTMTKRTVLGTVDTHSTTSKVLSSNKTDLSCRRTIRHPAWQLCMLVLSIYALASLSLETLIITDPEITSVLVTVDLLICMVFFMDFLILLFTVQDKKAYMLSWGWIDLISSIPMVDPLRWGRLARVIRILNILRAIKSIRVIGDSVKASPFETLSVMTFVIVFVSFSVSAGLVIEFERGFDSQIRSSADALWWSFLSILNAKGGFGTAVSPEGILNTVYLNKVGLLLFAYINGSVVAWLLTSRKNENIILEG